MKAMGRGLGGGRPHARSAPRGSSPPRRPPRSAPMPGARAAPPGRAGPGRSAGRSQLSPWPPPPPRLPPALTWQPAPPFQTRPPALRPLPAAAGGGARPAGGIQQRRRRAPAAAARRLEDRRAVSRRSRPVPSQGRSTTGTWRATVLRGGGCPEEGRGPGPGRAELVHSAPGSSPASQRPCRGGGTRPASGRRLLCYHCVCRMASFKER